MTTVDQLTPQQRREGKRLRRRVIVETNRLGRLVDMYDYEQTLPADERGEFCVTDAELAEQRAKVRTAEKALVDFGLALGLVR